MTSNSLLAYADELEAVCCDQCGSHDASFVFRRPDHLQVVECRQCGLAYLSPRPVPSAISALYSREYFTGGACGGAVGYSSYLSHEDVRELLFDARRKLAMLGDRTGVRNANLLELGCATGEACKAAAERGALAVGCDLSPDAIQIARSRYPDIDFCAATTDALPFRSASFDIVLAFELIEHVPSPAACIAEISRVLRGGGVLVLTTPNLQCGRKLGWSRWLGFSSSFEHLYFFDARSLSKMLARHGLRLTDIHSRGSGQDMRDSRGTASRALRRLARRFTAVRTLYRAARARVADHWSAAEDLHTLMAIAVKAPAPESATLHAL